MSESWEVFLSLLDTAQTLRGVVNKYKASELLIESRIRNLSLTEEAIADRLKESIVLLLKQNASYSFEHGEMVYSLPGPDTASLLQAQLVSRSRWERMKSIWRTTVFPLLLVACKTFVGLFLLFSLSLVILALLALLIASSTSRRSSSSHSPSFFFCPFRFWPLHMGGWGAGNAMVARRAVVAENPVELSFTEAVFSFIFGDGPEEDQDSAWLRSLRSFLAHRANNKRFKGQEFCPFLLHPPPLSNTTGKMEGEHVFMAPILWRFQGHPVATDQGVLQYEFPTVNVSNPGIKPVKADEMFREKKPIFSLASLGQQKLVLGLGIANFVALGLVWSLGRNPEFVRRAMARGGVLAGGALWVVNSMFVYLALYAFLFLAIPACRYLYISKRRSEIDHENGMRELWRRKIQDCV